MPALNYINMNEGLLNTTERLLTHPSRVFFSNYKYTQHDSHILLHSLFKRVHQIKNYPCDDLLVALKNEGFIGLASIIHQAQSFPVSASIEQILMVSNGIMSISLFDDAISILINHWGEELASYLISLRAEYIAYKYLTITM